MTDTAILHPTLTEPNPRVVASRGNYLELADGRLILDASGGPAVACLGHGDGRVLDAVAEQMSKLSFCHSLYWGNDAAESLAKYLVQSTGHRLTRCTFYGSGSEAVEAAMKLACQYHVRLGQQTRTKFVARCGSFHGTTLGALALTERENKRSPFTSILPSGVSFVDGCHPYRGQLHGETLDQYRDRLLQQLEAEFLRLGPENVCAFVAETVGGSGNGCVPPVPGYFPAVRSLCDKYGILLVLDEILCGMGRTGSMHAWQQESVVPDIEVVAKGLAAGYLPLSAMLISPKVLAAFETGSGFFNHGHTFQNHAVACAAALRVQSIIAEGCLLDNIRSFSKVLEEGLKSNLASHRYVGDIRGRGALWAIEFVRDKATKEPFPPAQGIAKGIWRRGIDHWGISMQPYSGTADGLQGDHVMVSPAYNVSLEEVQVIIERATHAIVEFFEQFDAATS